MFLQRSCIVQNSQKSSQSEEYNDRLWLFYVCEPLIPGVTVGVEPIKSGDGFQGRDSNPYRGKRVFDVVFQRKRV